MIGVLGDQHLGDEGFGWNAALDDPCRCRRLDNGALARPAPVARTTRHQHPEGGWNDIEPLGNVFADLVKCAAAAWTGLVVDIDQLLDPLEMGGKRTAVGLAWSFASLAGAIDRRFDRSQSGLDIFKAEVQLVIIELLGTSSEAVTLESLDDRP